MISDVLQSRSTVLLFRSGMQIWHADLACRSGMQTWHADCGAAAGGCRSCPHEI
jgi:hypothetical protein